tara:strand:- start:51 stop:1337 length:1287 start_codon:yes stop_codon:yes gene_type:complete
MSSSASPNITSILTETDSFPLIQNVTTTGPAYRMDLKDVGGSGSAYMLLGNQAGGFASTGFAANYRTGSNASKGEIIMAIGKNGSPVQDRFIVQSEPGPIATNSTAELTLAVGGPSTDRTVLLNYQDSATSFTSLRVGNQASGTGTSFQKHVAMEYKNVSSSFAGFVSSSENSDIGVSPASPPFGIVAGANLGDPAFFIDQGGSLGATDPVTASLVISNNGHVTASGNISASGTTNTKFLRLPEVGASSAANGSIYFGAGPDDTNGFIYGQAGTNLTLGFDTADVVQISDDVTINASLLFNNASNKIRTSGSIDAVTNITASGTGLFQAGKPIITHTTSPISSSLANAGKYHIVGGTLTASIVLDSTCPIGAEYEFFQTSSVGQFLFESASGTTVISKNGSLRLAQQGSSAVLKKVATDTFHLMGDLT